jgi:predicted amino acid-binding ACT domain protein
LLTPLDQDFAPNLVRNLENANQMVSQDLLNMAMLVSWFNEDKLNNCVCEYLE